MLSSIISGVYFQTIESILKPEEFLKEIAATTGFPDY